MRCHYWFSRLAPLPLFLDQPKALHLWLYVNDLICEEATTFWLLQKGTPQPKAENIGAESSRNRALPPSIGFELLPGEL